MTTDQDSTGTPVKNAEDQVYDETYAMRDAYRALHILDSRTRNRVMNWLCDRLSADAGEGPF